MRTAVRGSGRGDAGRGPGGWELMAGEHESFP